jgi:hypothetical protein
MNRTNLAAAVVAALTSLAVATTALADSRLFSVRTDRPDVTIDQASFNGQPLTVSGKGGGVTFFRIDNPAGAIPCGGHFQFTASNGLRSDADVDLCAVNWELTLPARMSWMLHAGPRVVTPATVGPHTVTITTDDPNIGISDVFMERTPVSIVARAGNSVQVSVEPDQGGIRCERDLGLRLYDGRTIARRANICANNWSVLVMLAGESTPPPPPAPAPAPPPGPTPPPAPLSQWSFASGGGSVSLINGAPASDEIDFLATCQPGSGQAAITVSRAVPGLRQGMPTTVTLSAGGFTKTYSASGSPFSQIVGGSEPQFSIAASDPLWSALIAEAQLIVGPGHMAPYVVSLHGSSIPTRQFLAACSPVVVAPAPPPGASLQYVCDDGSGITVVFNELNRTAFVSEPGLPSRLLPEVASPPGQQTWAAGPFSLIGADEDITWTTPGRPPRVCNLDQ